MGLEDDYRALLVARHRTLGTHKQRGKKLSKVCAGQVSTLIGYGSPNKADTHDVHGAPLGKDGDRCHAREPQVELRRVRGEPWLLHP